MMTSLTTTFIIVNCYFITPCGSECSLCLRVISVFLFCYGEGGGRREVV